MDMKAELMGKVDEIVNKIKSDKAIAQNFQKNPVATVEKLLGIDLPDEQIQAVVNAVKAKIDVDKLSGLVGGLFGKK